MLTTLRRVVAVIDHAQLKISSRAQRRRIRPGTHVGSLRPYKKSLFFLRGSASLRETPAMKNGIIVEIKIPEI
jgi:hypothetical protein